jgi:hypothetical protein
VRLAWLAIVLWCAGVTSDAEGAEVLGPAYLVYAGPYSASPSSAFGHLFLALASEPGQPPPLWDVITFNAETFGSDPVRYFSVGIVGGFLGRFSRVDFHEKTRQYGVLDDRDLWLIQLELTPGERRELDRAIERRAGAWFPYTFFAKNCAYYLQLLIAEVASEVAMPSGIVSPTGVFEEVQRSAIGGATFFRPALSRRLLSVGRTLKVAVRDRLERSPWTDLAADTAWHHQLAPDERKYVQELFALKAVTAVGRLSADAEAGLAHLRALTAIVDLPVSIEPDYRERGEPVSLPGFHHYSRLRVTHGSDPAGSNRTTVAFRGALHDGADPWYGHRPMNEMELLSVALSTTHSLDLRLESAVLFSQRALAAKDWVRDRRSWMLEVQARRGGLLSTEGLHFEMRSGGGKTFVLPLNLHGYGLVTLAGVGEWGVGAAVAPGLEVGILGLSFERWRWGARVTTERHLTDWSRSHDRIRGWVRLDLGA